MYVNLISITPEAEKNIAYCARVSSFHQDKPKYSKLIKYLIDHKHWSPFEMATMTIEIVTSRAIAQQILRHRSFSFQEFSQRYAAATSFETYPARRQDIKNRQNSIDDMSEEDKQWFQEVQNEVQEQCERLYNHAIKRGIAKEQARFLLPLSTTTKLYMTGNIRSWIHYLELRCDEDTQLEHREIAQAIQSIFREQFPEITKALGWSI